eukprot:5797042-Pleurochrysis_carterae.AAC.1
MCARACVYACVWWKGGTRESRQGAGARPTTRWTLLTQDISTAHAWRQNRSGETTGLEQGMAVRRSLHRQTSWGIPSDQATAPPARDVGPP